jgi:hypothetical protein
MGRRRHHRPALPLHTYWENRSETCEENRPDHGTHLETRLRGLTVIRMRHFLHWFQGDPHPVFFVSVASKGISPAVSRLFATLAGRFISVASKGVMGARCWRESNGIGWEILKEFEGPLGVDT